MNRWGVGLLALAVLGACQGEKNTVVFDENYKASQRRNIEIETLNIPKGASKAEELLYVLEVNKSMNTVMTIVQNEMTRALQVSNPNINTAQLIEFQDMTREEMQNSMPEFISEMALIYSNKFTDEEIQQIIDFYITPVGRKFVSNQTVLANEGAILGQAMEQKISERVMKRMKEKYGK